VAKEKTYIDFGAGMCHLQMEIHHILTLWEIDAVLVEEVDERRTSPI